MTILVQLHGGLGNQMFQAAAGLALAKRSGAPLAFDLSRFREKGLRGYALEPFGLPTTIREAAPSGALRQGLNRLFGDKLRPAGWRDAIYREPHFQYSPAFERLAAPVMLTGYFQSPRYWAGLDEGIARAFAPEKLAGESGRALGADIPENSVALHLRRGDFSSDPAAAAVHGTLGWDYYDRAISALRQMHSDASVLVFSDSPAAAAEGAARWPRAFAVAGKSAGDDLYLMSLCRHHIIANSSFSWWSAWLDRRPGGMRIAPRQWFAAGVAKDTRDLCPRDWLRL